MPFEIVKPGTHIDFVRYAKSAAILSAVLILIGFAAIPVQGFRLGIDFAGGTEIQVNFTGEEAVDEAAIRAAAGSVVEDVSVVRFGAEDSREFLIKFSKSQGEKGEVVDHIMAALREQVGEAREDRVEFVGPKVGEELRADGLRALAVAGIMVLLYIAFRFTTRFAPGAIVAALHDVLVTGGLFVIMGMEFDLRVLAAMLAIVGYSLNDTIIIYDRIRENMEIRTKQDLPEVINHSINQMLGRTILTSGTTLLAVLALLFLGGEVIRPFAIAMSIGIVVGTYSSIYIAAPTLLLLENRAAASAASGSTKSKGKPNKPKGKQKTSRA
ncbi:MAG: protein translocase subunit SecF [Deltaproteobacteria bacterium]|nr:protein translocase subunit SecF [Deltaproteobacteria bacterium]MBW2445323.1 protein translocase subunit SecF [Deltaproteobacteria bacterium]